MKKTPEDSSKHSTIGFPSEAQSIQDRLTDQDATPTKKRPRGRPRIHPVEYTQEELDERKAERLIGRIMGRFSGSPADAMAAVYGDNWKIDEEDRELLGEVTELWVRNRLQLALSGDRLYDFLFFGFLIVVYAPKVVAHVKIMLAEKKRKKSGASPIVGIEGDGEVVPVRASDKVKPTSRYHRPAP